MPSQVTAQREPQHTSKSKNAASDRNLTHLTLLTVLLRLLTVLLGFFTSYLPQFDTSPALILPDVQNSLLSRAVSVAVRWDAFHFLEIAKHGYVSEHQYAFMPGVPAILRAGGWLAQSTTTNATSAITRQPSAAHMIVPHFFLATLFSLATTRTLYALTLHYTDSPRIALLTGYLSLLPSSPATLHLSPYAEGWYAWGSYRGMLYCARRQWVSASVAFMFAGVFRANAVLLGGFIAWGMLVQPVVEKRRLSTRTLVFAPFLVLAPSVPFLLHQLHGYVTFCIPSRNRPWCNSRVPFVYPFVQSHYWNVGFLRYWEVAQIPNFIIAAPVLGLVFWGASTTIPTMGRYVLVQAGIIAYTGDKKIMDKNKHTPPLASSLLSIPANSVLPHAIHALILALTLLFSAHTQIILRFASALPFTYWCAARLLLERPSWGRAWVTWSILWGALSVVLWGTFLPPA
ncbi:glycosyltransferase family 76 protein [Hysterangium stoloniferum]|nr:glycosyltransferase family 76 protein [Hysterangium stoloniferum]